MTSMQHLLESVQAALGAAYPDLIIQPPTPPPPGQPGRLDCHYANPSMDCVRFHFPVAPSATPEETLRSIRELLD